MRWAKRKGKKNRKTHKKDKRVQSVRHHGNSRSFSIRDRRVSPQ